MQPPAFGRKEKQRNMEKRRDEFKELQFCSSRNDVAFAFTYLTTYFLYTINFVVTFKR